MSERVSFIFHCHGENYPVTVDASCNVPTIEIKGLDVTELICGAAHTAIINTAVEILIEEAAADAADFQQAFGA